MSQKLNNLTGLLMLLRIVMGTNVSTIDCDYAVQLIADNIDSESHVNGNATITADDSKYTRSVSSSSSVGMNKVQPVSGIPGAVATCLVGMSKFHVPSPTTHNSTQSNTPAAPFMRRGSKTEICLSKQTEQERVVRG